MAEKVVTMVIKVDLQCYRCYKKVRKVIGQYPEIRDQVYDEEQNKVKIIVVSCCPERIKKKIYCKGGESVESIEIVSEKKEASAAEELKKAVKKEGGDKPKGGGNGEMQHRKDDTKLVSGYPIYDSSGKYLNLYQPYNQEVGALPADYSKGGYGVKTGYNMNFCDNFSDENTESCTVM